MSLQAATTYKGYAKQLVHHVKFERAGAAAESLALAITTRLYAPDLPGELLVSWIPTATSRVRSRGYDQSKEIARHVAHRLQLPYAPLLARSGQQRQVGHTRGQRLAQLEQAFRPINLDLVRNKNILLIDDVSTTGATLAMAAQQLRIAGTRSVHGFVFAQA